MGQLKIYYIKQRNNRTKFKRMGEKKDKKRKCKSIK